MGYSIYTYEEQIQKKTAWLAGDEVLTNFTRQLELDIKMHKEYPPAWYRDHYLKYKET